jgi:hypothetical protein
MLKLRSADPFVALHHAASPAASPGISRAGLPTSGDELLAARDQPPVPYGSDPTATPLFLLRGGGKPDRGSSATATAPSASSARPCASAPRPTMTGCCPTATSRSTMSSLCRAATVCRSKIAARATAPMSMACGFDTGSCGKAARCASARQSCDCYSRSTTGLIGQSPAMVRLREQIGRFAPSPAAGAGARAKVGPAKNWSPKRCTPRADDAVSSLTVNCGALPRELIESELFGHERGCLHRCRPTASGLLRRSERAEPYSSMKLASCHSSSSHACYAHSKS